jgi:hypothetical protein
MYPSEHCSDLPDAAAKAMSAKRNQEASLLSPPFDCFPQKNAAGASISV